MKRQLRLLALLGLLLGLAAPVFAQSDQLTLTVVRNFGYGGGVQIQGQFTMSAKGPADLTSVTFKIDETVVATVASAPFQARFVTDDYPLGFHDLTAVGQTAGGQTLTSAPRRFEFVSAAAGNAAVGRILLPIFGGVGLLIVGLVAFTLLDIRRGSRTHTPLGAERHYGVFGGTVCPKCGRPFGLHWWALNALASKFDRCPHCGKWSLVRPLLLPQLRAAEAAELASARSATPVPELPPEEKLRRQLDDSRFDGR
jgi:hypothetical protein